MMKVKVIDNGSAFCVTVNGLIVSAHNSLGNAWRHIAWMYCVASQNFVVGDKEIPAKEWLETGKRMGYLDEDAGFRYC
jgi:hypothetical protein